jgi:hypothetical protein
MWEKSSGIMRKLRPATLRRYAEQAGFPSAEILPLETDTWRCYRLRCSTRKSRAADEDASNPLT